MAKNCRPFQQTPKKQSEKKKVNVENPLIMMVKFPKFQAMEIRI